MSGTTIVAPAKRNRLGTLMPLLIFLAITVFLAFGLVHDPSLVPSPLIHKAVPEFDLPPVQGRTSGLANTDLAGDISMVNVFASWCTACREEHPLLMRVAKEDAVPVHGLNYKDNPADAARWLDEFGDPYTRTGADINGHVGIDWGVYGVPETYIIDRNGVIAYKHIGAIKQSDWEQVLLPIIQRLKGIK